MNNKIKCANKIWRKFSKEEKKVWTELFNILSDKSNFATKFARESFTGRDMEEERQITAHNMTCQVVWWLQKAINENKKKAGVV